MNRYYKLKKKDMRKALLTSICFSMIILLAGCSGLVNNINTMKNLQDTIAKKYGKEEINLNITNGKYLTVSFVNSRYNKSNSYEKQKMACEIGKIVLATLNEDSKIETGVVSFVERKSLGVVKSSKTYNFDMKLDSLSRSRKMKKAQEGVDSVRMDTLQ